MKKLFFFGLNNERLVADLCCIGGLAIAFYTQQEVRVFGRQFPKQITNVLYRCSVCQKVLEVKEEEYL